MLLDQFEADWSVEDRQFLEATLSAAPPNERAKLLRTLIGIDAERRRDVGRVVVAADYLGRFDALLPVARDDCTLAAPTEGEIRSLIAPHLPTTVRPHALTVNDGGRGAAAVRTCGLPLEPPALPCYLEVDVAHGCDGLLGRGGMGAVWAVRDLRRSAGAGRRRRPTVAAVKALLPDAATNPQLLSRFAREAAILKKFDDPAVPRFRDYRPPTTATSAYILTDLVVGETFERLLDSRRQLGRAGCDDCGIGNGRLRIFRKIVAAVARAHRLGLIHRDLKPSNMMVRVPDRRRRRRVYLLDFGMAWMPGLLADPCDPHGRLIAETYGDGTTEAEWSLFQQAGDRLDPAKPRSAPAGAVLPAGGLPMGATRALDGRTATRTLIGSLPYMAPEQARRCRVDARADVYSLGLILVEILTGEQARDGAEAGAVIEKARSGDLSTAIGRLRACAARSELIELAIRCASFDSGARPADAGVMLAELDALSVRDPRSNVLAWDTRTLDRSREREASDGSRRPRRIVRARGGLRPAPARDARPRATAETVCVSPGSGRAAANRG